MSYILLLTRRWLNRFLFIINFISRLIVLSDSQFTAVEREKSILRSSLEFDPRVNRAYYIIYAYLKP